MFCLDYLAMDTVVCKKLITNHNRITLVTSSKLRKEQIHKATKQRDLMPFILSVILSNLPTRSRMVVSC